MNSAASGRLRKAYFPQPGGATGFSNALHSELYSQRFRRAVIFAQQIRSAILGFPDLRNSDLRKSGL
jgi:hypothetical protein